MPDTRVLASSGARLKLSRSEQPLNPGAAVEFRHGRADVRVASFFCRRGRLQRGFCLRSCLALLGIGGLMTLVAHSRRSARSACGVQWWAKRISSKLCVRFIFRQGILRRLLPEMEKGKAGFADPAMTRINFSVHRVSLGSFLGAEVRFGALGRMNARAARLDGRANRGSRSLDEAP